MIDFAHTPLAFKGILPTVRKMTKERLIHVFGAAGKRDHYKRPQMGELASEYANILVLTAEDPRNEPVEKITNEIIMGIQNEAFQITQPKTTMESGRKYIVKIPDRKEAINFAI